MIVDILFGSAAGETDEQAALLKALYEFDDATLQSPHDAVALADCLATATFSAKAESSISRKYCRELGWLATDLAAMMVMQCALAAVSSGEFHQSKGCLSQAGEGYGNVWGFCLSYLATSGRISTAVAAAEIDAFAIETARTLPNDVDV
jgi:hypothetical protein